MDYVKTRKCHSYIHLNSLFWMRLDVQHDYSHLWHYAITASGLTSTNTASGRFHTALWQNTDLKHTTLTTQSVETFKSYGVSMETKNILYSLWVWNNPLSLWAEILPSQSEKDDQKPLLSKVSRGYTTNKSLCCTWISVSSPCAKKTNKNKDKYNWTFGVKISTS